MSESESHRTKSGRILTDEEGDALVSEVEETDYDVEAIKTRVVADLRSGLVPPMLYRFGSTRS
jgi:hypothetical protein